MQVPRCPSEMYCARRRADTIFCTWYTLCTSSPCPKFIGYLPLRLVYLQFLPNVLIQAVVIAVAIVVAVAITVAVAVAVAVAFAVAVGAARLKPRAVLIDEPLRPPRPLCIVWHTSTRFSRSVESPFFRCITSHRIRLSTASCQSM